MKKLFLLLSALLISACITGYNPRYYFNHIQVVNLTGGAISQIEARVIGSEKIASCESAANNAICYDYFGKSLYPQQGIEVNWIHTDGQRKSETLSPGVSATFSNAFPLQIIIEINVEGIVDVFYKQDEPNGKGGLLFIN